MHKTRSIINALLLCSATQEGQQKNNPKSSENHHKLAKKKQFNLTKTTNETSNCHNEGKASNGGDVGASERSIYFTTNRDSKNLQIRFPAFLTKSVIDSDSKLNVRSRITSDRSVGTKRHYLR